MPSPFFSLKDASAPGNLAFLHLRRDLVLPIILQSPTESSESIENTRFGSYPHSTLVNQPWGSQILASQVDTGSRGRAKGGKKLGKRKRNDEADDQGSELEDIGFVNLGVRASSGFAHLLPPTPETWTIGLPHRTQVVYTPDYSYILQRLSVRPGDRLIEAGAGSGSFTHAAARAVFNGYESRENAADEPENGHEDTPNLKATQGTKKLHGKVYSFEFHEPRFHHLQKEIIEHGLEGLVRITHRDVYNDGFTVPPDEYSESDEQEPKANAIFLDLPAPWLALPHLTREGKGGNSALDPRTSARICTFSPCIEQVTKTISTLCELGWVDVDMVELQHKRVDVFREKTGLKYEGLRGVNPTPNNIEEALERLREVEGRTATWYAEMEKSENSTPTKPTGEKGTKGVAKQNRLQNIRQAAEKGDLKLWKEGRIVHRTEPELKTHTSYLVFAVLPRAWTDQDEENARRKWDQSTSGNNDNEIVAE